MHINLLNRYFVKLHCQAWRQVIKKEKLNLQSCMAHNITAILLQTDKPIRSFDCASKGRVLHLDKLQLNRNMWQTLDEFRYTYWNIQLFNNSPMHHINRSCKFFILSLPLIWMRSRNTEFTYYSVPEVPTNKYLTKSPVGIILRWKINNI
jgi:hypothetical protein